MDRANRDREDVEKGKKLRLTRSGGSRMRVDVNAMACSTSHFTPPILKYSQSLHERKAH